MTGETPREYDREFVRPHPGPVQTRVGYDHDRGQVVRFLVQLEYNHDGEWHVVVRYDHDERGSDDATHDVTREGLHIDIYRDGEPDVTEYVSPPLEAGVAMDRAEDHLSENLIRFVKRYERWHGIKNR